MILAESPALSPDGKTVAFAYDRDVWTVPVEGGVATRLTVHPGNDGSPAFSPDGERIAFTSDRPGHRQVFVEELDGGTPKQVTFHTEGYSLLEWHPSGDTLLTSVVRDHHWRRPQRLAAVDVDERTAERILFDAYGRNGTWSPDGDKLLFTREGVSWWRKGYVGSQASQIWMWDRKSGEFTELLKTPGGSRSPLWKPDGDGFYYVGSETGSFNLAEYDLASGETKTLTRFEDDSVVEPCISRDGKTVVFRHLFDLYSYKPGGGKDPVKIDVKLAGDGPHSESMRRALASASDAVFTPDGLEIVFAAGGDLWAMDTILKEPVQITDTPEDEEEPVGIDGGKAVLFLKSANGQTDVYRVQPADEDAYWWQTNDFTVTRVTSDAATESNLQASPDGKHFAVCKDGGDLWLMKLDGTPVRRLVEGFRQPSYDFSPDGKWIAYSTEDNDFNDDVWIVPTDGSREAFNVSRHPDDDTAPVWSPDGKILAFTGRRYAEERDIYYVYLSEDDDQETSRDRTLKKAVETLNKARGKKSSPAKPVTERKSEDGEKKDGEKSDGDSDDAKDEAANEKKSDLPETPEVDFDTLQDRLRRISIPGTEYGLFFLPDGKTLAFQASVDGQRGTYVVEIGKSTTPRKLTSTTGSRVQRLKSTTKVGWLTGGKPGTLSTKGTVTTYSFNVRQEMPVGERMKAAFNVAWQLMSDNWYDDRFGNRNWAEIRRKYADAAGMAADTGGLATVVQMMLGELNGSHLGFYPRGGPSSPRPAWVESTPHLGLRFEPDFKGPGLKVRDVILDGPADKKKVDIDPGDVVTAVDGTAVDPAMDLTQLLNGSLLRDIELTVKKDGGDEETFTIRPTSYSSVRSLLYPQFETETRAKVEEMSGGKLGYIHVQRMADSSFREYERQLFNAGYGKDGLIIDVRENGGGSTTDHMLTTLTQPIHAITVPRNGGEGYPQDRKIYATWNKPIVVLCNQNSFSNAEIFSHAVKQLKRGRVVGVTTAGGVISTGASGVMDVGTLRQPFRGWYLLNGEDMELNGAVPHFEIWPLPGELPAGKDRQLNKAVQVLKKEVKKFQKQPRPELRKATEREVQPPVAAYEAAKDGGGKTAGKGGKASAPAAE